MLLYWEIRSDVSAMLLNPSKYCCWGHMVWKTFIMYQKLVRIANNFIFVYWILNYFLDYVEKQFMWHVCVPKKYSTSELQMNWYNAQKRQVLFKAHETTLLNCRNWLQFVIHCNNFSHNLVAKLAKSKMVVLWFVNGQELQLRFNMLAIRLFGLSVQVRMTLVLVARLWQHDLLNRFRTDRFLFRKNVL